VRFYDGALLVKTHARVARGQRSTDPGDFPESKRAYAHRDLNFLLGKAAEHGEGVGRLAARLLDSPLPWTRMRRVYALLGLARKYGTERIEAACRVALAADMLDIHRLRRMLELPPTPASIPTPPAAPARFLRPKEHYALDVATTEVTHEPGTDRC
jgi:hypothetical protein